MNCPLCNSEMKLFNGPSGEPNINVLGIQYFDCSLDRSHYSIPFSYQIPEGPVNIGYDMFHVGPYRIVRCKNLTTISYTFNNKRFVIKFDFVMNSSSFNTETKIKKLLLLS